MMRRILCYGDSNTYGHNPIDGSRLSSSQRWTGILQELLGSSYQIIEEGLCGRTTTLEDPVCAGRNGLLYLQPCLESHWPFDMLIIMLGTNDLQCVHQAPPQIIAMGLNRLLQAARTVCPVDLPILVVSPPHVGDTSHHPFFGDLFPVGISDVKSRRLAAYYRESAALYNCRFLNAADFAKVSVLDGLHMDPSNHRKLAQAIASDIQQVFPSTTI